MFTLAQPACHFYNPYEELAMQQELQRRRQIEAYLRRQREAEEMERRRREYEAAVRAEYERRRQTEFQRQRAELQRRRQGQQANGRHSMYDGGLESLFDALYGGQPRARGRKQEDDQSGITAQNTPTSSARSPSPTPVPAEPTPTASDPIPESELNQEEPQVDTAPSHAAIQSILSSFSQLQSEFTFPIQLDFLPNSSKLAYTPNNAPLHGYEHALTGLLTRLDAVESYGDDGVRKARKEVVKTIEKELERLDGVKAEAWKRTNKPAPVEADVDPASVPLPEDEDMEDISESEKLPATDQRTVSEEPLAPADPQIELAMLPESDAEHSTSLERSVGIAPIRSSTPLITDTELILTNDMALAIPLPQTPTHESFAQLPTPTSPLEASDSDSDSELELVELDAISAPDDKDTDLEKDSDLELMGDWDLDF
ncbi:unnamed protein product [Rhizoctonia solani]|uniref:BAG domain-containing protein n=1 Tax=Rhizoctonia solani TaxID=456999 RepID=A0A8H3DV53_9AGAM|nr:unnamed protein product [Rhizoctonia solani]